MPYTGWCQSRTCIDELRFFDRLRTAPLIFSSVEYLMNKHIHLVVDSIKTETPVLGVQIILDQDRGRIDHPRFSGSVPGYKTITITHDGSNQVLRHAPKHVWVTKIAYFSTLESYRQHIIDDTYVFTLRTDDTIMRVDAVFSTLRQSPTNELSTGLWQIITFKRPGVSGLQLLPRLLVPIQKQPRLTIH